MIFAEDAQVLDQSEALEVWTAIAPGEPSGGALTDVDRRAPAQPHGFSYPEISFDTFEVVRIERGIPRFLVDMDTETIPLEAGIEDRAISFTKGCYVGQEVIVRVTHRGGGRVAKKLVRWKADPSAAIVPLPGARIFAGPARHRPRHQRGLLARTRGRRRSRLRSSRLRRPRVRKLQSCGMIRRRRL